MNRKISRRALIKSTGYVVGAGALLPLFQNCSPALSGSSSGNNQGQSGQDPNSPLTSGGEIVLSFGEYGSGPGQLNFPRGLTVNIDGNIYVADSENRRIQCFDSKGNFIFQFGSEGTGPGQFQYPVNVAHDSQGNIFVTDMLSKYISKFSKNGDYLSKAGQLGVEYNTPFVVLNGVVIDSTDQIYGLDGFSRMITVLSNAGSYVTNYFIKPFSPQAFAIDNDDYLFAIDTQKYNIMKMTKLGVPIKQWSEKQMVTLSNIAVDKSGYLYLTNPDSKIVKIFDSEGNAVKSWSSPASYLTTAPDGNILLVEGNSIVVRKSGIPSK